MNSDNHNVIKKKQIKLVRSSKQFKYILRINSYSSTFYMKL